MHVLDKQVDLAGKLYFRTEGVPSSRMPGPARGCIGKRAEEVSQTHLRLGTIAAILVCKHPQAATVS